MQILVTLNTKCCKSTLEKLNINYTTLLVIDELKTAVFRFRQNDCNALFSRTDKGPEFQACAAAARKAWLSSIEQHVDGMISFEPSTLQQTGDDDVHQFW